MKKLEDAYENSKLSMINNRYKISELLVNILEIKQERRVNESH